MSLRGGQPGAEVAARARFSWLTVTTEEFTRLHPTKEGEKPQSLYVALYVENGANDTYRTATSAIDEINREKYRVRADFVTLPLA